MWPELAPTVAGSPGSSSDLAEITRSSTSTPDGYVSNVTDDRSNPRANKVHNFRPRNTLVHSQPQSSALVPWVRLSGAFCVGVAVAYWIKRT